MFRTIPLLLLCCLPLLAACGEEIMNEREVRRDSVPLCRACAGDSYYDPVVMASALPLAAWALAETV